MATQRQRGRGVLGCSSIADDPALDDAAGLFLKGFITRRVRDEGDAEDILQDVLLKVHNNIDSLREADRLGAWLYQVTRNAIADYFRPLNLRLLMGKARLEVEHVLEATGAEVSLVKRLAVSSVRAASSSVPTAPMLSWCPFLAR